MSFDVQIVERPDYLHFKVTGENSPDAVRGYLAQVRETCIARGCGEILVEEHLRGPSIGTLDMFNIAAEGSVRSRSLMRRIAYVDTNPQHAFNDVKFIENVAANRGMNIRSFRTVGEAEAWLTDEARARAEFERRLGDAESPA